MWEAEAVDAYERWLLEHIRRLEVAMKTNSPKGKEGQAAYHRANGAHSALTAAHQEYRRQVSRAAGVVPAGETNP